MAKDIWNKAKLERFLKEGRGAGQLESYKPWLTVHDVSTRGRNTRLYSHKLNRMVNLFSDLQTYCIHLLEFDDRVVDIREQFPLLSLDVNDIELDSGLSKKIFSDKHEIPHVLTTTFLVNKVVSGVEKEIALLVKYAKDLERKTVIQRAEIMRRYFQQLGIDFYIVTENDICQATAKQIASLMVTYDLSKDYPTLTYYVPLIKEELAKRDVEQVPIKQLFRRLDEQYGLQTGSSAVIFKHLLARKDIVLTDLTKLDFRKSMNELGVNFMNGVDVK